MDLRRRRSFCPYVKAYFMSFFQVKEKEKKNGDSENELVEMIMKMKIIYIFGKKREIEI